MLGSKSDLSLDHSTWKRSSAGEAVEPPGLRQMNADIMTEYNPCMDLDHPLPTRIDAQRFEDEKIDGSLLDLRTELNDEPDGFEPGAFVEVISPPPRLHHARITIHVHYRHDRL